MNRLTRYLFRTIALLVVLYALHAFHKSSAYAITFVIGYAFSIICDPKLKWEPRDTWVGLFHDRVKCRWQFQHGGPITLHHTFRFFLVIIPCLPLIWDIEVVTFHKMVEDAKACDAKVNNLFSWFLCRW